MNDYLYVGFYTPDLSTDFQVLPPHEERPFFRLFWLMGGCHVQ